MESKELLKIRVELLNLKTICVNEQLYEIHAAVRDVAYRIDLLTLIFTDISKK